MQPPIPLLADLESGILLDVVSIALIALVLSIAVHIVLRRRNPHRVYGMHGNVWTQPFGLVDLPVVSILLIFFYFMIRWSHAAAGGEQGGAEEAMEFSTLDALFSVVLYVFLLGALFFFLGFLRLNDLSELFGLTRLRVSRVIVYSVVGMIPVYLLVALVMYVYQNYFLKDALGELEPQELVKFFAENTDTGIRLLLVISTCVVAPVVEEFLFRGYIYPVIKRFSDHFFAAVFTSLIFAVVHMNVPTLAPLWALAMCFTLAYELTGCLWVPIGMHAIFNAINVSLILSAPHLAD